MLKPRPPDANTENEIDDTEDHHFKAKLKRNEVPIDAMDKANMKTSLACSQQGGGKKQTPPFTINRAGTVSFNHFKSVHAVKLNRSCTAASPLPSGVGFIPAMKQLVTVKMDASTMDKTQNSTPE